MDRRSSHFFPIRYEPPVNDLRHVADPSQAFPPVFRAVNAKHGDGIRWPQFPHHLAARREGNAIFPKAVEVDAIIQPIGRELPVNVERGVAAFELAGKNLPILIFPFPPRFETVGDEYFGHFRKIVFAYKKVEISAFAQVQVAVGVLGQSGPLEDETSQTCVLEQGRHFGQSFRKTPVPLGQLAGMLGEFRQSVLRHRVRWLGTKMIIGERSNPVPPGAIQHLFPIERLPQQLPDSSLRFASRRYPGAAQQEFVLKTCRCFDDRIHHAKLRLSESVAIYRLLATLLGFNREGMTMQNRTILLFDIMDTIVYNPFNREVPAFFGLSPAALVDQKDLTVWEEFELGQIDEAEYFRRYFHDGRTFDRSEFRCMMHHAYRWVEGAEELLGHMSRRGFEIHALSNYPVWYRAIEAKLRLSRYLQWTFVSCLTGVRKPAAAAFEGPALTLNRPLDSFLLIDDNAENCEAAMAIGMPAIRFEGVNNLLCQLQNRGLVPEADNLC